MTNEELVECAEALANHLYAKHRLSLGYEKSSHAEIGRLFKMKLGSSGRPGSPGSRDLSAAVEKAWSLGYRIGTKGGLHWCDNDEEMEGTLADNKNRVKRYRAKVRQINLANGTAKIPVRYR